MKFHEHLLWCEIAGLLDATGATTDTLAEIFQQPQVAPKNHGEDVAHMKQWWANWTDPRGKVEKAKRLIQATMNKIGRDGMRGGQGEDLLPALVDIRGRLMRLYAAMPDPMRPATKSHEIPKFDYDTSTAGSAAI